MNSEIVSTPAGSLKKTAGWVHLWALGVGGVISGNYFGWQTGLLAGGFGGLLLATLAIAVMYICLVLSIAELSAALPDAGGFYNFTRAAFGKDRAFLNGVSDTIEYVTTPAVIVSGIAGYMKALVPGPPDWVWWVAFYFFFVAINILGAEMSFGVSMAITVAAAAVLFIFYAGVVGTGVFAWQNAMNIAPDPGASAFLPKGWYGVFAALPYAVWFYLAIEQLPLSAEESQDVARDMPKALIYGMVSLLVLSCGTLILNSGIPGGADAVGKSAAPLELGFQTVFGGRATSTLLSIISLTGLVASFHAIVYAYGRLLFALARAGYFPAWLAQLNKRAVPGRALAAGGIAGVALCFLAQQYSNSVGAALLNMAVFGALISYILVLVSFIRLRVDKPEIPRPYRSPLGIPGAAAGIAMGLVTMAATFAIPAFRPGVTGTVLFIVAMLAYYGIYRRKHV